MPETKLKQNQYQSGQALYRPSHEEDLPDLSLLYESFYHRPLAPELWRRLVIDNPAGSPISYVAEDKGRIIGGLTWIPTRLKVGQHIINIYHGGPIIHPKHRRRGICSQLSSLCLEDLRKCESAVYGFATSIMSPFLIKHFHAMDLGKINFMKKNCSLSYSLKRLFRIRTKYRSKFLIPFEDVSPPKISPPMPFENLEFTRIHDFDESFDTLWDQIRGHHNVLVIRDRQYLRWRFVNHPEQPAILFAVNQEKSLKGYLVLRIRSNPYGQVGVIEDLVVNSQEWLKPVLRFAETWLKTAGCDTIHFYFSGIPAAIPILKQMGFQHRHSSNSLVIKSYHPLFNENIIPHYESWYLTTSETYFA